MRFLWNSPNLARRTIARPSLAHESLENRALLSVSPAARLTPQERLLAQAVSTEKSYLAASKTEVRLQCADLLRQVASASKANDAEIRLSGRMGDLASVAVNRQDKAELSALKNSINAEQRNIQAEVNDIIKQIDQIGRAGRREIAADPANADSRLQQRLEGISNLRAEAEDVFAEAISRRDEAEAQIATIRGRTGAEGSLGVFTGNPTAVIFFFPDGNTTSGDMTAFLQLQGNRLIGQQAPGARDSWSVATYDGQDYRGQNRGTLVAANIDCTLDSDGKVQFGQMTVDVRISGRTGPLTYGVVYASLSSDRRSFSGQLLNLQTNTIVGQFTLSRP